MDVVLRAIFAYFLLLFGVRLLGRRASSQLAPFDLVVLFLFAGATITAVLGADHSMVAAIGTVFAIGLTHNVVGWLKARYPWVGRIVDGTPVVIFECGEWHDDRMRRLQVLRDDVMYAARQRGLREIGQIRYAVVERDGKISVIEQD